MAWRGPASPVQPEGLEPEVLTYRKTKDTQGEKQYEMKHTFQEGGFISFKITATAGRPYVVVREDSSGIERPSWAYAAYAGFQPDTVMTDSGSKAIEYKESRSMGSLPWCRWMLACKKAGPERDMIGFFPMDVGNWVAATVLMWDRTAPDTFWEFYHSRGGQREYALAALDRDETGAPARVWRELNPRP